MKLIVLFAVVSLLRLTAAPTYAQDTKIYLNLTNTTLEEAIKTVEAKTQYVFFFNHSDIDLSQKVSVNANGMQIREVLKQMLVKNDYRIENNKIVVLRAKDQDDGFITGRILDTQGEPIIGANVVEEGTSNGTITDIDGNFSLKVAPGKMLVVTYIGYTTQQVRVTSQRVYEIKLEEDALSLSEVVVVGYGIQKKVNVIGSISQVGPKELQNRSTPQLSNALTGLMPGVSVIQRSGKPGDSSGTIRVRGVGSIGSSDTDSKSDALVLIDGIPGDLNTVNSEDVESISVLKDASSAAIYGSRAANGVILVTTKTGTEGKISVNYNGYVGFNEATALPEFVNSWEWAELYNKAIGREEYTADMIQKMRDGSDPDNYANEKYLKKILDNRALQTSHNVSINGGNQKNRYMLSFGYLTQDGIVDKNNYTRYDARANIINELAKGLKLTTRLAGTYSMRKEPNAIGGDDANGMTGIIQKALRFPGIDPTVLSDGSYGAGPEQHGTPVSWIMSPSFYERPLFIVNANVRLDYNPIKDLTLSAIGAFKYTSGEERGFKSTHRLGNGRVLGPSFMQNTMTKTIYKTFQATADYAKTFADVHNVGVLLGYSWEDQDYSYLRGTRDNFPSNTLHELNAGSPDNQKNEGKGEQWAIQSYFGRFQYNYAEKYLFESTVRYDGSSRFHKDNRFAFFPSLALGWKITEESFIRDNEKLEWLSQVKLKASWGRLGNQNIGIYPYQSVYALGQNYPFGDSFQQGAAVTTAMDPSIKWEETETLDGGIEVTLWRGLLSLNASYFYRKTMDILYRPSGSVSSVLGQSISFTNTGELKNVGWEFELGHRNRIGNVNYNINANLTYVKNEVVTLGVGNVDQPNGMVGNGSNLFIGYPMQMYYGYVTDGVFLDQADIEAWHDQSRVTPRPQAGDLRYKDISGPDGVPDGQIDPQYDRVYLGSRIPKYSFGINMGAQYKDFDLSIFLQGVSGVKGQLTDYAGYGFWSNTGNVQRWQAEQAFDPENPVRYPKYPRLEILSNAGSPNTALSDFWLRNGSYLRIKNVQIGYTLPQSVTNHIGIKSLRLYAQGENLFTFSNYPKGWDPEINTGGVYYPILRTITFGVNLNF